MGVGVLPVCMYVYHLHAWCYRGQKMALDRLRLELQTVVSCHMDVENESASSRSAASALKCCAVSPAPVLVRLYFIPQFCLCFYSNFLYFKDFVFCMYGTFGRAASAFNL